MTNREYALLAGKTLSAKKAQDIVIIDIQGKASFADFFVINTFLTLKFSTADTPPPM